MRNRASIKSILFSAGTLYAALIAAPECRAQLATVTHPNIEPSWRTDLLKQVIDKGYSDYRQLIDIDGDGNIDYCRIVGDGPARFLSCQMGTAPGYLSKEPYGFNSPAGIDVGSGPRGIIPGTKTSGPAFCRYVNIAVKEQAGPGSSQAPSISIPSLRCIAGDPPIKDKARKFYATDYKPCGSGFDTQQLLIENRRYSDPYLYCENSASGEWSASRVDEQGVKWSIRNTAHFDRIAGNYVTDTLIRQLTYLPDPKYRLALDTISKSGNNGTSPIRFDVHSETNAKGATTTNTIGYGPPEMFVNGSRSGWERSLTRATNVNLETGAFDTTWSVFSQSSSQLNCTVGEPNCPVPRIFKGTSANGADIIWAGTVPTPQDVAVDSGAISGKFASIYQYQQQRLLSTVASSDAALAAKGIAGWSATDVKHVVKIMRDKAPVHPGSADDISWNQQTMTGLVWGAKIALTGAAIYFAPEAALVAAGWHIGSLVLDLFGELGNDATQEIANEARAYCYYHRNELTEAQASECRKLFLKE